MRLLEKWGVPVLAVLTCCGCGPGSARTDLRPGARNAAIVKATRRVLRRVLRSTGTIQPVDAVTVPVPQLSEEGNLVLTRIAPSGTVVKAGDIVAEFDRSRLLDRARDARSRFEDLSHQLEQKKAQHRSDAEKRASEVQQAEAALAKASIELRKGPLLSEIDRLKQESVLEDAKAHLASLRKTGKLREQAEAADLKILELQRDRQKLNLDRAESNAARLQLKAPMDGMVSQETVWRRDGMGHPQEGDQLWPGQPLVRIFTSREMEVQVSVGEPDGTVLQPGASAIVRPDAYPDVAVKARYESASPVASSQLDSPVKIFNARFRLDQADARLSPDLSAAVEMEWVTPHPVLAVPRTAVHYRNGQAFVTLVSAGGARAERAVTVGAYDDGSIEVVSGLEEGQQVLEGPESGA